MAYETAGALANKALSNDNQDGWDLAREWTKTVIPEVWKCIDIHKPICQDKEFFVIMLYADDCMIPNCIRRKFYAWPWMPKPRPRQSVWLYRKETDDIQGMWSLPNAELMARLATDDHSKIPKEYTNLAVWCRSFFKGTFPQDIRKFYKIDLLTEEEYNSRFLPELVQPVQNNLFGEGPDAFDFEAALTGKNVINSGETTFNEKLLQL